MLKISIAFAALTLSVYIFRRYVRRVFYVLRTRDRHPDWKMLERKWYGEEGRNKLQTRDPISETNPKHQA